MTKHSEKYKSESKERLKKILGTKFMTTTIFPLSQFETAFGHLWGQGKLEKDLTKEERVMLSKWNQCRESILNVGNQQKRNAFAEIDMHEVSWNRYTTVLYPVKEQK